MKLAPGPVRTRAMRFGTFAAVSVIVLYTAGGLWLAYGDLGFAIAGAVDRAGPSNPRLTGSVTSYGAWLNNYASYPALMVLPLLGLVGPVLAPVGI